jgi:hypothetical protein
MKISISSSAKKLGVPLFILLFLLLISASAFGDNEEKKNGITGYLGSYFLVGEGGYNFLSFSIEYERKLSGRVSLAAGVGYAPLKRHAWAGEVYSELYERFGDYRDFTLLSKPGFTLIFDFGVYIHFPFSNKCYELFLYLGNSYYWMCESHKVFDNKSPRTASFSTSESYYSLLDAGFGFKYRFNEQYSFRAEWRMKNLPNTMEGLTGSLQLGLSYRF